LTFPQGFKVPQDQGGPGRGQAIGGFGGDPSKSRDEHRNAVQSIGKAPVILLHGNSGAADSGRWNMLDLQQMLIKADYPRELIWAPSYLGTGTLDLQTPHVNNVNEVREFIDNVCEYLGVAVVDIIAHSLGCTLAYAIFRGLRKPSQGTQVKFDNQLRRWNRVGTFVALAGGFHGLGPFSVGEWESDGVFMRSLLAETVGGGGESPYGTNDPRTPEPAHNIRYFCGVARGDFIDNQNPGTGKLAGAINKDYDLGPADIGHEKIKESQVVFNDFLPQLNAVPPGRRVAIVTDKASGNYAAPLTITVHVEPSDRSVDYVAKRVTKEFRNGFIVTRSDDELEGTLQDGQTVEISADGMWEVVFSAQGTAGVKRTYWVGVDPIQAAIVTDNSAPFEGSLDVIATTTRGTLYHSLKGDMWSEGPSMTITSDAAPQFIAIDSDGSASEVVTKAFRTLPAPSTVTATVVEHYVARRISLNEFLTYGQHYGFTTQITLHMVNGRWVPVGPPTT
jgi:pimeloyl-ACP methyl ester carboxylesterase